MIFSVPFCVMLQKKKKKSSLDKIRQQHPHGDLSTIPPLPASAPPILVSEEEAIKALETTLRPPRSSHTLPTVCVQQMNVMGGHSTNIIERNPKGVG